MNNIADCQELISYVEDGNESLLATDIDALQKALPVIVLADIDNRGEFADAVEAIASTINNLSRIYRELLKCAS